MDFEVKVDTGTVERMLGDLSHKANLVMSRAANRAATTAKKTMRQEVEARYRISSTEIGNTIEIEKANSKTPFSAIRSRGYHSGLEKFKVSPLHSVKFKGRTGRKKRFPGMYKSSVKKGEGLKGLGKRAFVATMRNGHTGVFIRTEIARSKIKALYGPSVPQMVKNKEVMQKVEAESGRMLQERLLHEVDAVVRRYAD